MQHEDNDRAIAQIPGLRHSSHQSLLFLIIEMTRSGNFLSHELDDL